MAVYGNSLNGARPIPLKTDGYLVDQGIWPVILDFLTFYGSWEFGLDEMLDVCDEPKLILYSLDDLCVNVLAIVEPVVEYIILHNPQRDFDLFQEHLRKVLLNISFVRFQN